MSQPPLESTHIGTNTKNVTMSYLDSTHIGTKALDSIPLKRTTEQSEHKGKAHVQEYFEPDPSSSDS